MESKEGSEKINFKKNNSSEYKEVPKIADRKAVVEKEHAFGHFQVDTTLQMLSENYFWKNMRKDVEAVVYACGECLRHQKVKHPEHPAKATKITGLFDRVGMDLTFGFPESEEGYIGLLVIYECQQVPICSSNQEQNK